MWESFYLGLAGLVSLDIAAVVVCGIFIGLIFGVVPGLSGLTILALLLPAVYKMEPLPGLAFLLSAHASVYTGGAVSAIMLGIPGSPPNAATVPDGFAMQRSGTGMTAVGAALLSSATGGLIGAIVLILLLPFLQQIVLAFGAPEIFLLVCIGIVYASTIGREHALKGLVSAGLGVFLATVGYQSISGVPRFWFGSEYLLDGVRIIPLILGLFAIPEIIGLMERDHRNSVNGNQGKFTQLLAGFSAVVRRPALVIKSAFIGVFVGIVPGIGGETAPYLAYGSAKKQAREPETFGHGCVEGVIAPESSNNAKEGGSLIPTLALGIPGSASMSLLLGGFLILGIEPGPDFLNENLDLAISLSLVLALTNILAAIAMFFFSFWVSSFAAIRGTVLAPILLVVVVVGVYLSQSNIYDIASLLLFGALGLSMNYFGFSRPPLILGFILGGMLETYYHITMQAYGISFLARPLSLILVMFLCLHPVFYIRRVWSKKSD